MQIRAGDSSPFSSLHSELAENRRTGTGFRRYLTNYAGPCVQFPCIPAPIFRHLEAQDKQISYTPGLHGRARTRRLQPVAARDRASRRFAIGTSFHACNNGRTDDDQIMEFHDFLSER